MTAIIATAMMLLILLVTLGIAIGQRQMRVDTMLTDGDLNVLCYCDGCGCRHRRGNMDWTPAGAYRCQACCYQRMI